MIVYKKEYDELVTEMLIKLESLVEYLMNGIETPENVSIYVVGGCKYYTNFANKMKEALGDKAMICNPTREVENTSHGCWKVVHDMMEGKVKIEGSDSVWGFENEENEEAGGMKCIEEDKKKDDVQGESEGGNNGSTGNAENTAKEESKKGGLARPKTKKRIQNQSGTPTKPVNSSVIHEMNRNSKVHSSGTNGNESGDSSQKSCDKEESHSVTIKVCDYPRLPLPHRLKTVDFAQSIRDFMKKMLVQEKEILKINLISTLWNDISKRIYEEIDQLEDQDKADELLIKLNKLDKKKYTVLMDSVDEMNREWKKLADGLKVNIEKEMDQINCIQNEWKEEKLRIENIMDSKATSKKSTLKRGHDETKNEEEDNDLKRMHTRDHCAKRLLQMQKQLLELQDELLKQEEEQRQKQLEQQQLLKQQEQEQKGNERYSQLLGNLQLLVQEHIPYLQAQLKTRLRYVNYEKSIFYQIRSEIWKLKNQINKGYRYKYESRTITALTGKLDEQLQQLQQYNTGINSLYMQEQLLTMLQQYEQQHYEGNSNIPYSEISKLTQRYKQDGISIHSRIKQLKENILYYYKNFDINVYLDELDNLQILLSFRFYEMSGSSLYLILISQLQQFIPQDQHKDQERHQEQVQNDNQNQNQNQKDNSFQISKLQQITSIQKGLSSLFPEILELGIEDSSNYPQLDHFIELLSKYLNGYYSYFIEIQEQLDKLPELLEELKQKHSVLENESNLKTVTTVNIEKVTKGDDLPKAEESNQPESNSDPTSEAKLGDNQTADMGAGRAAPSENASAEKHQETDPTDPTPQADNQGM